MNDTQEIHRDIYVGMVAEEMAQSGYYGEDLTLYGFLAQGGTLYAYESEQECAEAYLLALVAGAGPSRLANVHRHCKKKRAAIAETRAALEEELRATLAAEAPRFSPQPVELGILETYTRALPKPRSHEKDAAIVGIMTLPAFAMGQAAREAVLDVKKSLADEHANRHFFGFFVKRDGRWQPEMNGALPTILAKWLAAAETAPVSPILPMHLASNKPVYQLRETFAALLAETMDDDYLAMLDALYASRG